MNCAKCKSEMIQAKNSWLCMSCGHLEAISPNSVPLVSKKQSSPKAISQDMAAPSPKLKPEQSKAAKPTEPEGEKKSDMKPEVVESLPSQPEVKSEEPLVSAIIQDSNKVEPKSAEMPSEKPDVEAKPNDVNAPSVAPSAAELHPLGSVVISSAVESPSAKNEVVVPETPPKDGRKTNSVSEASVPVPEIKPEVVTPVSVAIPESPTSDVETAKSVIELPSVPKNEAITASAAEVLKTEPAAVAEVAPTEPVISIPAVPVLATKPIPPPVPDPPVPVTPPPVVEIAPTPETLKTVAPETHPGPVNVGLIVWIIVAMISFIALVVFGYAFYRGIDLFAALRK